MKRQARIALASLAPLALAAALSFGGCAVYGTELRSLPAFGAETPAVYDCPKPPERSYAPRSGPGLCFSVHGVRMEVEAPNVETLAGAIGPFPLVPFFPRRRASAPPLRIDLAFEADVPHAFAPWEVSVQTDQGKVIRVSAVSTNVRDDTGVHTVATDPLDRRARTLEARTWTRFFLVFDERVASEQSFHLTLHLIAQDGSDIPIPTIEFRPGKISYFGTIP